KNILKYDNRPFKDLDHMADTIINNYNSVVSPNDNFYFLGDFCFNSGHIEKYLERLNGNLFFIKGNHDRTKDIKKFEKYGTYLGQQYDLRVDNKHLVLNHFALRVWNGSHRGSIHLYGHSHMSLEHSPWGKSMDVCIIGNNYYPYELNDIIKIMDKRNIKIIDHHDTTTRK